MPKKKHLISKPRINPNRLFLIITPLLLTLAVATLYRSATQDSKLQVAQSCSVPGLSGILEDENAGEFDSSQKVAFFNGKEINAPAGSFDTQELALSRVLGTTSASQERWIEVDLSDQKLTAWDADKVFLETLVASGLPHWPTPVGEFTIWTKFEYTKMEGGQGRYYYNLPNVPYTMFFYNSEVAPSRGYGLHGAYWHDEFGTQRSHGCVNLPISVAEKLFYWTTPQVPEGKSAVRATAENPGTKIVIHE